MNAKRGCEKNGAIYPFSHLGGKKQTTWYKRSLTVLINHITKVHGPNDPRTSATNRCLWCLIRSEDSCKWQRGRSKPTVCLADNRYWQLCVRITTARSHFFSTVGTSTFSTLDVLAAAQLGHNKSAVKLDKQYNGRIPDEGINESFIEYCGADGKWKGTHVLKRHADTRSGAFSCRYKCEIGVLSKTKISAL